MPTFCRHNRFIERCPICSKTLLEQPPQARPKSGSTPAPAPRRRGAGAARTAGGADRVRVRREARAADDGYRSPLAAGLRASDDAYRLAQEIAFSSARLRSLEDEPPGLYGELRELAGRDIELASFGCLLIAYLSPLQGEDPFAGIRRALADAAVGREPAAAGAVAQRPRVPDLDGIQLGPRTSHDAARGSETLGAYLQWAERAASSAGDGAPDGERPGVAGAGPQEGALTGDPAWAAERRFERLFERLALPGLSRVARYELLLTLGRLGLYELRPDSLHLGGARGAEHDDGALLGAKRVFGIADPLLLERRAGALAEAAEVPVEALDLALANWGASERATVGFPADASDEEALERVGEVLGI